MSEPYWFEPKKTREVAAAWSRKIHAAKRDGASPDGLKVMEADRRRAVSDALLGESGAVVGEHRRRMAAVEAKYPEVVVPLTSVELAARQFKLDRTRDRIRLMSDADLVKRIESEGRDRLTADRDVLAMLGVEAQQRGKGDLRYAAAAVAGVLATPAYADDEAWQESSAIVGQLEYWHDVATGKKVSHSPGWDDVPLPNGLGSLNALIRVADRETEPAPELRTVPGRVANDSAWYEAVAAEPQGG